ncbi:hypothetical protein [Streptomyces sp. NPDC059928]|uniref:hypothetical protein n=1 Tax=unclassified Streptomyces TaxID=2593676 RepID=UPI00365CC057
MTYTLTHPNVSEGRHAATYDDQAAMIHHLRKYSVWDSTYALRFVAHAERYGVAETRSGYGLIYRLEVTK